jgi:hypothetical protein
MTEMTLALRPNVINSMEDVERAAQAMAKSGYFTDARDAAQAVVKILAGQEMGFGPFASMTGIYIIQGRPSIGANLMAAAVKSSQRYNYRVVEMTDQVCEIEYLEYGKPCGRSRFTLENASKAGTKNLDKFPRNMLFARAMSNGCRWYCPDIFAGAPTYTPEEMGANVNEAGEVIDVPAKVFTEPATVPAPAPTSTQAQATATQVTPVTKDAPLTLQQAESELNSKNLAYGLIDTPTLAHMANALGKLAKLTTDQERKMLACQIILADRAAKAENQDDAAREAMNE